MDKVLVKICNLQPRYSSKNTLDMQERGLLVRSVLTNELRSRVPTLRNAFEDVFAADLAVEGSDGIGRKTEAPWVRLFCKSMSPTPREGFYLVIHFTADGSAVYITVGCGSTVWRGADLRPISDKELTTRTSWARSVVLGKWHSLHPYEDEITLGAKAPLPKTFEKATVFAKRIPTTDLAKVDLDSLLLGAAERLNEIYSAQVAKRDVSPGDQDALSITAIARPLQRAPGGQGRGLTSQERREVELQAMRMATDYLVNEGFQCQDTSATKSFDILASRAGNAIMVEVKGTTSDLCTSILMTKNEVELHRSHKGSTALLIVSGIQLIRSSEECKAVGGIVEPLLNWDIDNWLAEPIAFQLIRSNGTTSPPT